MTSEQQGGSCRPQIVDDRIEMNSTVQGEAEMVIEEFMVLGNRLVAEYMKKNHFSVKVDMRTRKYSACQI